MVEGLMLPEPTALAVQDAIGGRGALRLETAHKTPNRDVREDEYMSVVWHHYERMQIVVAEPSTLKDRFNHDFGDSRAFEPARTGGGVVELAVQRHKSSTGCRR